MGKFKAKKVSTPGSQLPKRKSTAISPGKGRPKKVTNTIKSLLRGKYKGKYTDAQLKEAMDDVQNKRMSERAAALAYGIPRSTLKDRLAERVTNDSAGRPTVLSKEEEELIVERLLLHGNWGFPLTSADLCHVIKAYLDSMGRTTRFVQNMPGPDFVTGFLQRHPELTVRKANMIKRARAGLSRETVQEFFDRFAITAKDIPPCNIFNYDETNMQDNPGCVKAIFKKGTKYAEQVRNHSKSAISVMFCCSATGQLLPPYVVYKGANCYEAWGQNGIKGSRYSSTKSGWFDSFTFEECFKTIFLPSLKKLEGKKLLIGDNLSSHISIEVINLCREHNIEFVCLPPNSTDKMQPLDVGLFGPMKNGWRKLLREYSARDPTANLLQKTLFPKMLKELVLSLHFDLLLPKV
jgi:hypothetical protein